MLFAGGVVIGESDVVLFDDLRMWAERGLVHIEDTRTGDYKVASVQSMLERMNAISEVIGNSNDREAHSESQFDQNWRQKNQQMLERMVEVVRRAREQGTPDDPSARRDLVRRRPKTILVPGFGGGL